MNRKHQDNMRTTPLATIIPIPDALDVAPEPEITTTHPRRVLLAVLQCVEDEIEALERRKAEPEAHHWMAMQEHRLQDLKAFKAEVESEMEIQK